MIEVHDDHTLRGLDVRRCVGVAPDDLPTSAEDVGPGPPRASSVTRRV